MTDDQNHDEDMLAAEFVLRLLDENDLKELQQRIRNDRRFAQRVAYWEIQLSQLVDEIIPEQPNQASKKALFAALFPEDVPVSIWQRVGVWQMLSAICAVGFLALGVMLLTPERDNAGPLFAAEIVSDAADFRVIAVVDKSTDQVILTKTRGAAPEGRILQVWAHGPDEPAISVGLWPEGDSVRLDLPPTIAAVNSVLTLGVSEEPVGGSITGSPSGRVFGTTDILVVSDTF
ncbi:Anti-sigma-K factor RskA [Cognatiyoonia koreensis]|uniref:Anti-sigma-K factor RskA n=1 Tax=Cognatiyoonia koreensis TaxID=364200 RepID=A0A1I0MJT2_9RHOB|nr:anti-sigma factor [Cognatiyoonia koreensis]SEV88090.1 Anti-sigma-K factor RskA [Cognatiyoonia koreensis]